MLYHLHITRSTPVSDDGGRLIIEDGDELPPPAGGKARTALGKRAEGHGPVLPVAPPIVVAAREKPRQGLEVHLGGEVRPGGVGAAAATTEPAAVIESG